MDFNFDEIVDRSGTFSVKYDLIKSFYPSYNDDSIVMFLADMDFKCPPALVAAVRKAADCEIYGYTSHLATGEYLDCVSDWYARRYRTQVKGEWILYSDGSVNAINTAINTFSNPGDGVIITPPVYGHFRGMIAEETCHRVVESHLINDNGYYTFDWDDFEEKCSVPSNRAFILCSPANPIGRVWSMEELARIADICTRHHVLLISDEIHSDIIRKGQTHTTILNAAQDLSNVIMVSGINKSFNTAGLRCSNVIIPDDNLRGIFSEQFGSRSPTPFGLAAQLAAYRECEDWLDALNGYLDSNIDFAVDFFAKHMPRLKVYRSEGTYMLWLDFSAYGLTGSQIHDKIYLDANVILQDGTVHDSVGGEMFQRMCLALPKSQLEIALGRIASEFEPSR